MMLAWLPLLLLSAKLPIDDASLHKVEVRIAGPLALVDVWRAVEANVRTAGEKQVGSYFDLNLPEGAALLDWEVIEGRTVTRLGAGSEVAANAALSAGLKLRRLSLPATPADEGTGYRIHITPIADGERAVLHYRYSAPAGCKDGWLVLRVPDSLEENPTAAEVTLTIEPLPDGMPLAGASLAGKPAELRAGSRKLVLHGVAPARAAWEIGWSYATRVGSPSALPGVALAAAARVAGVRNSRTVPEYELAGLVCRTELATPLPGPARVLLLVDRSRSVGQGGLSAERLLARQLMEALPPAVAFNAILFGATAEPVFALPRMPTREALEGFTTAADPNRLENGTDVAAALERARGMLGADGAGTGRTWVALVTDGALPAGQTFERMHKALAAPDGHEPKLLVLLVRQHGDEEVPATAVAEYARFARGFGGLLRVVAPGSPGEIARGLVAGMARGGDLLDLRLENGKLADALPPGAGASLAFTSPGRLPQNSRLRISARGLDGEHRTEILPVSVKREWLDPLLENGRGKRRAWSGATAGMAIAVLPGPAFTKQASDGVVRGRMDEGVLRNALALAFTPRARACYVSRRVAKSGDAYLRGRLKLELSIERGELHDAVVRQSTLDNPGIEDCVRRAAWAVEYPRPEHRDAPTVANLNLVFQPRTGPESRADATASDHEIELILGPLTFTTDFTDLLENKPAEK